MLNIQTIIVQIQHWYFPLKLQLKKKKKEERKLQVLELPGQNHAEP